MNERIRELAEQAGIEFFNSIDPEFSGREYCGAWTEQQQKFAELIVRDCALTAGLMEHEGRKGIGAVILDNFGVKE